LKLNFKDKEIAEILNAKDEEILQLKNKVKELKQEVKEQKKVLIEEKKESKRCQKRYLAKRTAKRKGLHIPPQRGLYHKVKKGAKRQKLITLEAAIRAIFAPGIASLKLSKKQKYIGTGSQNVSLIIIEETEAFTQGLCKYFRNHPNLLNSVIEKMDKGKFLKTLRQETLDAVRTAITPAVALAIKV